MRADRATALPVVPFRVPTEPEPALNRNRTGTGTGTYCVRSCRRFIISAAPRFHLLPPLGDLLLLLGRQHVEDLRLHLRLREGELGLRVADLDAQRLKIAGVARHHRVVERLTRGVRALGERPNAIGVALVNRLHLFALRVGEIAHHFSEREGAAHRAAHASARPARPPRPAAAAPRSRLRLWLILRPADERHRCPKPERHDDCSQKCVLHLIPPLRSCQRTDT